MMLPPPFWFLSFFQQWAGVLQRAPVPAGGFLSLAPGPIRSVIQTVFPAAEWEHAGCIAYHESGFNCGAVGAAAERGLFQIHPVHRARFTKYGGWDKALDCTVNALVAAEIWREQGWGPWTTKTICGLG